MGPSATALNKKIVSEVIESIDILSHHRSTISQAARAASTSSSTYPFSNTHFHTSSGAVRPPKRDFHSASAHPTSGFFFGRNKPKDNPPSTTKTKPSTSTSTEYDPRLINHLTSVSYSFSPINPGQARYHYGDDYIPPRTNVPQPQPEPEPYTPPSPTAEELNLLFATNAWSLSLANAGEFYPNWAFPDPAERVERAANARAAAQAAAAQATAANTSNSQSSAGLTNPIMASGDDEYAAFLDKASADREPQASTESNSSSSKPKHTTVTTSSVPGSLKNLKATYTSESDESFEPVSLERTSTKSGALTVDEVTDLIGAKSGAVSEISAKKFDPRGEYQKVFGAVEGAVGKDAKDLKVFKVDAGGARVEYWVLGVVTASGKGEASVVGVKALSVES